MSPRLKENINLNTIIGGMTILGMIATAVFYIAPLRSLPEQQKEMQGDLSSMKTTQAVQTQALKMLADIAQDTKETRRDSIRHDTELIEIRRRLDRIENR